MYKMNMDKEKEPVVKRLIPEGRREFKVTAIEPKKSKAGNDMFVITVEDIETSWVDTWYAIATEGKRWFLKQVLEACGVVKDDEGNYVWDIHNLIGKKVYGIVEHEPNKYINREGVEVETTQHKVVKVETIEWDA